MSNTRDDNICVQSARECVRLAQMTPDPELRHELFEMARDWMKFASDEGQRFDDAA